MEDNSCLKSKMIVPITAMMVLMVSFIFVYVYTTMTNLADNLTDERVDATGQMAHLHIDSLTERMRITAYAISSSEGLISAVRNWNLNIDRDEVRPALYDYLNDRIGELGLNSFVVFDRGGHIILRTYDFGHYGDNLRHLPHATAALDTGASSTLFISTPAQPMGLTGATPILADGEIIGLISAVLFFHTNEFVDQIAEGFNAEVTVFAGPTRTATTIRDAAGNREVGITAPREVVDSVMGEGFVVVADEIRKLAESSSEQSKVIWDVLKKIRESIFLCQQKLVIFL
jgi:hypothetical protein